MSHIYKNERRNGHAKPRNGQGTVMEKYVVKSVGTLDRPGHRIRIMQDWAGGGGLLTTSDLRGIVYSNLIPTDNKNKGNPV